jgi:hypothetical protein
VEGRRCEKVVGIGLRSWRQVGVMTLQPTDRDLLVLRVAHQGYFIVAIDLTGSTGFRQGQPLALSRHAPPEPH